MFHREAKTGTEQTIESESVRHQTYQSKNIHKGRHAPNNSEFNQPKQRPIYFQIVT